MGNQTTTTFGPILAKQIKDYVQEQLRLNGLVKDPLTQKRLARRECWAAISGFALAPMPSGSGEGEDEPPTVYAHSWTEVRWSVADQVWETAPDGRTGTTTSNYVIASDPTQTFASGSVLRVYAADDTDTGETVWIASYYLNVPAGADYEVLMSYGGAWTVNYPKDH
jgi:hypothetical protein